MIILSSVARALLEVIRELSFFYHQGGSWNLGEHTNFGNQKGEQKIFGTLKGRTEEFYRSY